jgi:hypothetical protein
MMQTAIKILKAQGGGKIVKMLKNVGRSVIEHVNYWCGMILIANLVTLFC